MSEAVSGHSASVVQNKSSGFLGGCLGGCLAAFLFVVVLPAALFAFLVYKAGSAFEDAASQSTGRQSPTFTYTWRWGDGGEGSAKVVRLFLNGVIMGTGEEDGLFLKKRSYEHALVSRLKAATARRDVKGVWIDIDSPGGGVTLSDEIRHALVLFKKSRPGRFVFARFGDQACSGGYYVATAADYIMAAPSSWTGSIGVIIPGLNAAKLAETIGVRSVNIASSENKAILDALSPVNTNHVAILQRAVDQAYDQFLSLVSESRGIPVEELKPIADGRILTAQDALEAKLIDAIGYEDDALKKVEEMAKAEESEIGGVRIYTMDSSDDLFRLPGALRMIGEVGRMLESSGAGTPSAIASDPPPQYSR